MDKFPSEVLELILTDCIGSSIIDLWKCGSKSLNYRLCQGGCREVSLEDINPISKSRFPKMLLSLQLRKLSINVGSRRVLAGSYELRALLLKLSSDLESLNLICRESESCFFSNPVMDSEHGVFASSTAGIEDLSSFKNVNSSPLWDISAKFPKLHTLSVATVGISIIAPVASYLPSTLTCLAIRSRYDTTIASTWPELPPNLTHLDVPMFPALNDFSPLPRHLKTFKHMGVQEVDSRNVTTLPSGLQSCQNLHFVWCQKVAENLPVDLTSMSIIFKEGTVPLSFLPKTLTSVNFRTSTLDSEHLRSLPHTVTDLQVRDLSWYYIGDETCFPPNLKSFTAHSEFMTPTFLEKLPRRLKNLSIMFAGPDCFKYLPPALESLNFIVGARIQPPVTMDLPFFPSGLKKFSCAFSVNFTMPKPNQQLVVYPEQNDRIPSCLTEFDVKLSNPPIEALPALLTKLVTGSMNPASFELLPPQLTSLNCELFAAPSKKHFSNLPRTLTMLEIRGTPDHEFEEDLFSALPASLVQFLFNTDWYNVKKTPFKLLRHLPPKLQELTIGIDFLENETFVGLPKSLVRMYVTAWSWDNTSVDIIPNLPPKMRTFGSLGGLFTLAKEVRRLQLTYDEPSPVV